MMMMNSSPGVFPLLDLPDVVHSNILDHLTITEVVGLRQVCRKTYEWVETYTHPHLQRRLKYKTVVLFNEDEVQSFVSTVSQLPFTKFFFRLDPDVLSKTIHPAIQEFMLRFAPSTTWLGVREMNLCITDGEFAFYNSFTSLESLRLDSVQLFMREDDKWPPRHGLDDFMTRMTRRRQLTSTDEWNAECSKARIPENLAKSLKEFNFFNLSDTTYPFDLARSCPNLESFSIGRISTPSIRHPHTIGETIRQHGIKKLIEYFEERSNCINSGKTDGGGIHKGNKFNFELDLQDHSEIFGNFEGTKIQNEFLQCIGRSGGGVKLRNVPQYIMKHLINQRSSQPSQAMSRQELESLLASIVSVVGISPASKSYELPNLEELDFTTGDPGEGNVFVKDWNVSPTIYPEWPKLKKITGRIDAFGIWEEWVEPDGPPIDDLEQISAMVDFVLRSPHKRVSVKELSFALGLTLNPPITPEHFVTNFPNVEILSLHLDSFTKENYSKLFQLLGRDTKIKRLKITTAVLFDDETFIGAPQLPPPPAEDSVEKKEQEEQTQHVPYFSTMKYLEHVKVLKYPSNDRLAVGITDRLCTEVLAGMSLKSFEITGHELSNVTAVGVDKLLEGKLGQSIKRFVFEHADAPRSEAHEMYMESLDKLIERCEFNKRFDDPKYKRVLRSLY